MYKGMNCDSLVWQCYEIVIVLFQLEILVRLVANARAVPRRKSFGKYILIFSFRAFEIDCNFLAGNSNKFIYK